MRKAIIIGAVAACVPTIAVMTMVLLSDDPADIIPFHHKVLEETKTLPTYENAWTTNSKTGVIYVILNERLANGTIIAGEPKEYARLVDVQSYDKVIKVTFWTSNHPELNYVVDDYEAQALAKVSAYSEQGYQIVAIRDLGERSIEWVGLINLHGFEYTLQKIAK